MWRKTKGNGIIFREQKEISKVSSHVCINIAIDNIGRVLEPRCKALSEADLLAICEVCILIVTDCRG